MVNDNTLNNLSLSKKQEELVIRIFNLVLGRVFKSVYFKLNNNDRKKMEEVFLSGNEKQKEKFFKKYLPNFKLLFKKEIKKLEEEIKKEIVKLKT